MAAAAISCIKSVPPAMAAAAEAAASFPPAPPFPPPADEGEGEEAADPMAAVLASYCLCLSRRCLTRVLLDLCPNLSTVHSKA